MTCLEVHLHDISACPVFISRFKAVRRNQRIFQAQSERQTFARAGAAQRHPVPVDAKIDRTVHQTIQASDPCSHSPKGFLNFRYSPAKSGQNAALCAGSTRKSLQISRLVRREFAPSCGSLFRFCSGRKSVHPHSNSRGPYPREHVSRVHSPRNPKSPADVTDLNPPD